MNDEPRTPSRTAVIVIAYPFIVLLIGAAMNLFVFGVNPTVIALPTTEIMACLVISAALLVINHSWLMTTTASTRSRFGIHSTPEEWARSNTSQEDAPAEGLREVERRLNAHRNATENTIYFVFLAPIFVVVSPPLLAVQIWTIGFAVSRLGYTYSYLCGKDGLRGIFMSLGLLATYGMVSYLLAGLVV